MAALAAIALFTACGDTPGGADATSAVAAAGAGFTPPTHSSYRGDSAVRLADGRILAVSFSTGEIYDPVSDTWTLTGPLNESRVAFSLVRLADGRVLAAGGWGTAATSAEIFDPGTNAWTALPAMPKARAGAPAALLDDGRVLFTTSRDGTSAYLPDPAIFNPTTHAWTSLPSTNVTACVGGVAMRLPNGRILFACGSSAMLFDQATRTFQLVQGFHHFYDVAAMLPDGRVLFAGGSSTVCELFDPTTSQIVPTGSTSAARSSAAAALLADGSVIVAGGTAGGVTLDSVERYDPASGTWTVGPPLLHRREDLTLLALPSGDALALGGYYRNPDNSSAPVPYAQQGEIVPGVCVPATCATVGATCGAVPDGCGGVLECGSCDGGQTCSTSHVCCTPTTCADAGAQCGPVSDGCGHTLDCGACGGGLSCVANACVCAPTTCAALGVACGQVSDGCGGTLTCSACPTGQTCNLAAARCETPPGQALWDPGLKVPACADPGAECDSGLLLVGRATKGPEPSAPNTLYGTCADGTSGTFHVDESLDRLRVVSADGRPLTGGAQARIEATVWAYSGYSSDKLDLYFTRDVVNPAWTYLTTLTPPGAGVRTLTATYTLPRGARQAVRGVFRYGGSEGACTAGSYDDHDDLVFAVAMPPDTTPPTVSITAPVVTRPGSFVNLLASATDDDAVSRVEFLVRPNLPGAAAVLLGSDATAPYSFTWNMGTTPAADSYLLTAVAYDAAGNSAWAEATMLVDGVGPEVAITAPAPGASVTSPVTLSATASDPSGIARIDFYVDGVLVGGTTIGSSPYTFVWAGGASGSHAVYALAADRAGNTRTSATVGFTLAGGASSAYATYSATYRAPACTGAAGSCDTGATLVRGRGPLGPEPGAPNTIGATCADGSAGSFHSDESIDALRIASLDGGPLRGGASARLTATVWAYSGGDVLDVYSAASASSPSWVWVGTATPTVSGAQTLSVTYTLPVGATQAVRAVFRYGGTRSSCPTGSWDDKDDLVFQAQ
ncbi:MAG TPA: Ig-like domain-containing protein [Anaeromyxobacter sp.]|nr:Ig-like domain-containing protein [Anaeromyxobacter sp.]